MAVAANNPPTVPLAPASGVSAALIPPDDGLRSSGITTLTRLAEALNERGIHGSERRVAALGSAAARLLRAYARGAIQIAGTGGLPLIVLTDHRDGKALSLVATVGIPPPLQEQIAAIEATDATLN